MNLKLQKICLLALVFFFFNTQTAEARKGGFISFGGETIVKVVDFPDTEDFKTETGDLLDGGCIFKQVSVMFIPLWNYDLRWCVYCEKTDTYYDVTREELDEYAKAVGQDLPAEPSLPFWHTMGGKLVFLLLIAAFIAYSVMMPDDEDEAEVDNKDIPLSTDPPAEDTAKDDTPKA